MNRLFRTLAFCLIIYFVTISNNMVISNGTSLPIVTEQNAVSNEIVETQDTDSECNYIHEEPETIELTETMTEELQVSDEEIKLIALITLGEAEGESEEGKRLVIDTILNRVDSEYFPNTISEVIYQKSQFSCVWNGRLDRVTVTDEVCDLVLDEINNRKNNEVMFFTAGAYGKYGEPMFQVGNHYFSRYRKG